MNAYPGIGGLCHFNGFNLCMGNMVCLDWYIIHMYSMCVVMMYISTGTSLMQLVRSAQVATWDWVCRGLGGGGGVMVTCGVLAAVSAGF